MTKKIFTKEEAKEIIKGLIEKFEAQKEYYKTTNYNETQTRQDFINPFFDALNWDISNRNNVKETERSVIHEDKQKTKQGTKSPDYAFTINGKRKFFVEAKKPSVSIKEDPEPAFQTRGYGWNAKLSLSVLTDFEEFAIYDCTKKIRKNDTAFSKRIKYIYYTDYLKNFDFIWDTFEFNNVVNNSLEKYAKTIIDFKTEEPVDLEFSNSLNQWRTYLATSISLKNSYLQEEDINFAVQLIIDRIVFLRVCEDRKIEQEGQLEEIAKSKGNVYQNLFAYFERADQKYNSGLFNFDKDKITQKLEIDNKVIKNIIKEFFDTRYDFAIIPVEILGFAYEQFLGKVIRLTAGHRAVIEEKPEVRKAGGVYYTPDYIVNYIVENTVGKLVEGKTPEQVSELKILDPSCGSGSFLIGVYQFLLDWHLDYYKTQATKNVLNSDNQLTSKEKKRILLNNIFGVDIDTQAVEVTKLSLLLKALEGETEATIKTSLLILKERVLPTIDNNIQCGNSLIAPDFYDDGLFLTPKEERKINVFDWKNAFPSVFKKGGFDAIIGNPPYGAELMRSEQNYLEKKYQIGNTDTAALFLMQAKAMLKSEGLNMYIIPKSFTYASNWAKARTLLISDITEIVDCSKVWKEVKLEMCICKSQKNSKTATFTSSLREKFKIRKVGEIDKQLCKHFNFILNGLSEQEINIGLKIKNQTHILNDFVKNQRGDMFQKHITDTGDYSVLGGKQIQRYFLAKTTKGMIQKKFVTDQKAYIKENSILVQRIVAHVTKPKPRIIIIAMIPELLEKKEYVIVDTINQLENISEYHSKFILGVLNSKLVSWYAYRFIFANAVRTMQFDNPTTEKIPFPKLDLKKKKEKAAHDKLVSLVDTMLDLQSRLQSSRLQSDKDTLQRRIDYTDTQINELVYQLYGISESEQQIIEKTE